MAKRTVTAVSESTAMEKINFAGAKMAEFGRVDKASSWVTFHCSLGAVDSKGFQGLFDKMGCWRGRKLQEENPNLADESNVREEQLMRHG